LSTTQHNPFYHLTPQPPQNLNKKTSLNPNILYKTYTPQSTTPTLLPNQKSHIPIFFPFTLTPNLIPKPPQKQSPQNHRLISTISPQHPFNHA
ncbi:lipase-like domain-containing protein, partial [Staphylococcus saprophyticus]